MLHVHVLNNYVDTNDKAACATKHPIQLLKPLSSRTYLPSCRTAHDPIHVHSTLGLLWSCGQFSPFERPKRLSPSPTLRTLLCPAVEWCIHNVVRVICAALALPAPMYRIRVSVVMPRTTPSTEKADELLTELLAHCAVGCQVCGAIDKADMVHCVT